MAFYIQDGSWLVDITPEDDFLGHYDQKANIDMGPVLNGYWVMGVFFLMAAKALL
jgi:hypothetical protein